MFWREHGRYIISFFVALILLIFVFLLIFKIGGKSPAPANNRPDMTQYIGTDASMELRAEGPIVAESLRQSVKITVSSSDVTFSLLDGYEDSLSDSSSYRNNPASFEEFVRALSLLGFDQGDDDQAFADEQGYCPTGVIYIFSIAQDGQTKQRYWRGNCGVGTFKGQYAQIIDLFKKQVPDFGTVQSKDLRFSF